MTKSIPLFGVVNTPEMEASALAVLRSGRIASGEFVPRFEDGLGALLDLPHIVSTVDMTSAMFLALHVAGVGPGDEVLTTAFACMATNAAIAHCGATPVWVDVKAGSVEVDPADFLKKVTARTKALILYHVAGYPGDAAAFAALCRQHGIVLIEDCDNALLARRAGQAVGAAGDFAVFSFYPNRQINTCEGGALYCRDAESAARARRLRRLGIDALRFRGPGGEINPHCDIPEVGWTVTMNNLSAALGCAQLAGVGARVGQARQNAAQLVRQMEGIGGVLPVPVATGSEPAFWALLLFVENRDAVLAAMKADGVHVSSLHFRNDAYTGFGAAPAFLPHTDYLQRHVMAVPCGWWLAPGDIADIVAALRRAVAGLKGS